MNQQCKVCGEPAAGFHFGAFTCEGCKSFFGRSYNNLGSITECKNQGACVINKKNRTSCKACRLRKCLLVGMSKSGSRYGRRSNWFKIHCLLQEQQQQQQQQQLSSQQPSPGSGHKSPPPQLGLLGPHALQQVLSRASTKEDLMLLGGMAGDDYKAGEHAASSPSGSSPESHNSDTSVEVGDARRGPLGLGLGLGLGSLGATPFGGRPPHTGPHAPPAPRQPHHAATAKELLLHPSLHPSLQSLPFMLPHPAFLPPAVSPAFMFPPGVLPRAFNNNNNNNNNTAAFNNNNNDYGKRFYLDSILHPPRPTYRDSDDADHLDEARAPRRRVASPPTPQPKIAVAAPDDDHPMDLSVRGGPPLGAALGPRGPASDACSVASDPEDAEDDPRRPASTCSAGLADDDRSPSRGSRHGSAPSEAGDRADDEDEDEDVDVEVTRAPERTLRVIPLDLSART